MDYIWYEGYEEDKKTLLNISFQTIDITDIDYFYAMGLLEGSQTAYRISQNVENLIRSQEKVEEEVEDVRDFLRLQDKWTRSNVRTWQFSDPYWFGFFLKFFWMVFIRSIFIRF